MPRRGKTGEEIVDANGKRHDVVEFGGIGPAKRSDVLLGDHRVFQRIRLVIELDDRARQHDAFINAEALGERACRTLRTTTSSGIISTSLINCSRMFRRRMKWVGMPILFRCVKTYSEMRLFRNALAVDDFMLLFIESSRIILEELDERSGFRTFIQDLGLAFVDSAATVHSDISLVLAPVLMAVVSFLEAVP